MPIANTVEANIVVNFENRFSQAVDSSVNRLMQKNKKVLTFGKSLDSVSQFVRNLWADLKSLSTFQITSNFTPDPATARKFARMIEDERIRINERRSI